MLVSSPRTWGCFPPEHRAAQPEHVFPTHVGVFLMWECGVKNSLCLPHARGGVSLMHGVGYEPLQSSPRTWGCFYPISVFCKLHHVFPTHVGVFLLMLTFRGLRMSLPHARGGVSVVNYGNTLDRKSSPRTWGCFQYRQQRLDAMWVFPTHVGVFLNYAA